MPFINCLVPVTVTEQPAAISGLPADLLEEVRQHVLRTAQFFRDAAGQTVGNDVIHRPAVGVQVSPGAAVPVPGGAGHALLHRSADCAVFGVLHRDLHICFLP